MNAIETSIYQDLMDALQILNPNTTPVSPSDINSYDGEVPCQYILHGPPGCGKTYTLQTSYISQFAKDNRFITTFHQAFSYEEFVEGLKPILVDDTNQNATGDVKYKVVKGIFREACDRAAKLAGYASLKDCIDDSFANRQVKMAQAIRDKKTVLLGIDEINRGNVVSIFGDLISLIESTKRLGVEEQSEMTVLLPYSHEEFGVPANLIIIGTMNTADRSIQLLDSALRRRFKFIDLSPKYDGFCSTEASTILKGINSRVRCLLNKDNQIGHSYLMSAKDSCEILAALYYKIIPLLEEYFYDDAQKVRFVLNDKDGVFYQKDEDAAKSYKAFMEIAVENEERDFYILNPDIAKALKQKDENLCKKYLENLLK